MDQQHLEEQLKKDYELLKELEDRERVADNPKEKRKLQIDIEDLKKTIQQRNAEITAIKNQIFTEEDNVAQQKAIAKKIEKKSDSETIQIKANSLRSLTDLAGFCAFSFPLLRWIHEPVPAEHVSWYFQKIHEFFLTQGRNFPGRIIKLDHAVECFFRCAYSLPSFDFQADLSDIDGYCASKLLAAYGDFLDFCVDLGYKNKVNPKDLSVLAILIEIRDGLNYSLSNISSTQEDFLGTVGQDVLRFMIYIIDFLFRENKARKSGKRLDLPEGIVLKLHDILNHAFKAHLGVKLPEREDDGVLADFPLYVYQLSKCWKDFQGNQI